MDENNRNSESHPSAVLKEIHEALQCTICWKKLRNPCSCPKCSKLYCYECIVEWLENTEVRHTECLNCKAPLAIVDLVKISWLDHIGEKLKQLSVFDEKFNASTVRYTDEDICQLHSKTLTFYCSECAYCVCNDCANDDNEHHDHGFKKVKNIYNAKADEIREELKVVQTYLIELGKIENEVEKNLEVMIKSRDDKLAEIEAVVASDCDTLKAECQDKITILANRRKHLVDVIEATQQTVAQLEDQLKTMSKSKLIHQQQQMIESCKQLQTEPLESFVHETIPDDFRSVLIPEFEAKEFKVRKFSQLPVCDTSLVSEFLSDSLQNKWQLNVYKKQFLAISLQMVVGITGRFEYRVELLHENSLKNIKVEATNDFELNREGQVHNLIMTSRIQAEGFLSKSSDTLRLKLSVRSPNILHLCRQQRQALHFMKPTDQTHENIEALKTTVVDLEKRSEDLKRNNSQLEKANIELKRNNETLEKNTEFSRQDDGQMKQIAILMKDKEDLLETNYNLKGAYDECMKIVDDLEKAVEDFKQINHGLLQKNNSMVKRNEDLTRIIIDLQVENDDLKLKFNDLQISNVEHIQTIHELTEITENLQRTKNDLVQQNGGLKNIINDLQLIIDTTKTSDDSRIGELCKQNLDLKGSHEALNKRINEMIENHHWVGQKNDELKRKIIQSEKFVDDLKRENEVLTNRQHALTAANDECMENVRELRNTIEDLIKTNECLTRSNEGLLHTNDKLQKFNDDSKRQNTDLKARNDYLLNVNEENVKTVAELRKKSGKIEEDFKRKDDLQTKKRNALEKGNARLKQKVNDLRKEIEDSKKGTVLPPSGLIPECKPLDSIRFSTFTFNALGNNDDYCRSEDLVDSHGFKWQLNVYNKGFLGVTLKMIDGVLGRFEYIIELLVNEEKAGRGIKIQHVEDFEASKEGKLHPLNYTRGASDKLVFKISVRAHNIIQLCRQQYLLLSELICDAGEDLTATFKISKFREYQANYNVVFSSFISNSIGYLWRLKIYPNGYGSSENKYLSAYWQMYQGVPGIFEHKIELLRQTDRTDAISRTEEFVAENLEGRHNLAFLERLESGGYLFNDTLVCRVIVTFKRGLRDSEKVQK